MIPAEISGIDVSESLEDILDQLHLPVPRGK